MKKINKKWGWKIPTHKIPADKLCDISIAISVLTIILNIILNIDKILSILRHLLSYLNL